MLAGVLLNLIAGPSRWSTITDTKAGDSHTLTDHFDRPCCGSVERKFLNHLSSNDLGVLEHTLHRIDRGIGQPAPLKLLLPFCCCLCAEELVEDTE